MDTLIRYGFTIDEVKLMMDSISFLFSFDDKTIGSLLHFLEALQCDVDIIKNIFICNPFCFTKDVDEIKEEVAEHLQKTGGVDTVIGFILLIGYVILNALPSFINN